MQSIRIDSEESKGELPSILEVVSSGKFRFHHYYDSEVVLYKQASMTLFALRHLPNRNGYFGGLNGLAGEVGVHERTVKRHIQKLVSFGAVKAFPRERNERGWTRSTTTYHPQKIDKLIESFSIFPRVYAAHVQNFGARVILSSLVSEVAKIEKGRLAAVEGGADYDLELCVMSLAQRRITPKAFEDRFGIRRSTVYEAIESLENLGLVSYERECLLPFMEAYP